LLACGEEEEEFRLRRQEYVLLYYC